MLKWIYYPKMQVVWQCWKGRICGLCLTPHLNSAIIPWTFFPFPVNNEHFDDKTDDNHTQNATIQSEYSGETASL